MLFSECMFLLPCTRQSLHFYFSLLFALSDFNLCFKPKKISGFFVVVLECNVYILKHFFHIIVYTIHSLYVTLEHKSSLKSLGYICSKSQKYIVWVKIIDFSFMPRIIRILKSCSMKIFCKFSSIILTFDL